MLFPQVAREILDILIEAENEGRPITLEYADRRWGDWSTWEELINGGYIERWSNKGVLVTEGGRAWLKEHSSVNSLFLK